MKRFRKRCWAWALGLTTTSAFGQVPNPPGTLPAFVSAPLKVDESAKRPMEIQVQLAWMADPLTFPYYLDAYILGNKLEIRGHVPTKMVHERALKLAFENFPLTILDAIRETPGIELRSIQPLPNHLAPAAHATLNQLFPGNPPQVTVQAQSDGRLVLQGMVASHEQKLALSHGLRHLPGCTGIINRTEVVLPTPVAIPASPAVHFTPLPEAPVPVYPKKTTILIAGHNEETDPEVLIITPTAPVRSAATSSPAPPTASWQPAPIQPITTPRMEVPMPQPPAQLSVPFPQPLNSLSEGSGPALQGVIPVSGTVPFKPAPIMVDAAQLETHLRSRIPKALKLTVTQPNPQNLKVDVWVTTVAEAQEIVGTLDTEESLTPYLCEIRIHHD